MKAYRIRHKETRLFYQPIKGNYGYRTNLGKNGKVYIAKKPNLEDIGGISISDNQKEKYNLALNDRGNVITKNEDWEIIEYVLVEKDHYNELEESQEEYYKVVDILDTLPIDWRELIEE